VLVVFVFRENSFAAPVVKIQSERGQHVVDTGPYAIVRHPMYGGALLFLLGMPLLLGSWWGFAFAPVMIGGMMVRTLGEERTLRDALAGYTDYMTRVRWRFVPHVW
jgi:protein-S-isoprenylcysteine O-methyltransferase Ste14